MTFLGIPLDFISEFFDTYEEFIATLPAVFLLTQAIIYKNLCSFEYSIIYKIYDVGKKIEEADGDLLIVLYIIVILLLYSPWLIFIAIIINFPYFFSLLVFAFGVMCILPFLNLVSVRRINKKLFLRKLSND